MNLIKKIFKSKENSIFLDLERHSLKACIIVKKLKEGISLFCSSKNYKDIVKEILIREKRNDKIKTNLELKLYSGELLPYTSEDWFELIEKTDDVADSAERVARLIDIKRIRLSKTLRKDIIILMDRAYLTVKALKDCISCLRKDLKDIGKKSVLVEKRRELTREKEYELLSKIFNIKLKPNDLILLDLIIRNIAKIANEAESASDRLAVMSLKYTF